MHAKRGVCVILFLRTWNLHGQSSQHTATRSRRLKCRPANTVRTCCPLGQLAPHCPLVLWPSSSLAAKIEECPGRRVDGSSRAFSGDASSRHTRDNPILATAIHARHSTASPPASPTTPKTSAQNSPMNNPVAYEVPVMATGARPGASGSQRELFTEEASTVLVFENGGVIRLSAAVTVGQLLFLTNKGTNREVVAQVMRKRAFRPTSCYAEVEFSEPSPGFWGIEFPEMPELSPANVQQKEAAQLVQAAEVIADEPSAPARAPSAHEITALKQQVEALREQLKLLQTQTGAENSSAPALTHDAPSESKQKVAASSRPGALRIGLVAALLLAAGGAARYLHWLPRLPQPRRISAVAASSIAAPPGPAVSSVLQKKADAHSNSGTTAPASNATPPPSAASQHAAQPAPARAAGPSTLAAPEPPAPRAPTVDTAVVKEKSVAAASIGKRTVPRPSSIAAPDSAAPSSEEETIVPPKLIKSLRAIASPEALRDFARGNVTLDAVVDPSGHVKTMKVLTGPPSLQNAAMDALKQYQYEPATQRGKPVTAHVTVTVKFLFEP
jgi:protein TonB